MLNMCLPHGKHAFTSYLQHVEHAVHAGLHYLLILFKPVVSDCISSASVTIFPLSFTLLFFSLSLIT
jgi:hypothetical protein